MPIISMETRINAPVEKVFDMARNVQVHCQSAAWTQERVVEVGKAAALEKGDSVTFEAVHLGRKRKLTSRISSMDAPNSFTDKMVKGPFKSLSHQHNFQSMPDGSTLMFDILEYTAPGGIFAPIVDKVVLEKYMREFVAKRNRSFKAIVEQSVAREQDASADKPKTVLP
jgi:ligand-binding SRPBCC domain-containing protein